MICTRRRSAELASLPMPATVSTLCMHRNVKEVLENDPDAYYNNEELLEPLKLMYRSLMATNDDGIANGRLLDVLRQVRPCLVVLSDYPGNITCVQKKVGKLQLPDRPTLSLLFGFLCRFMYLRRYSLCEFLH